MSASDSEANVAQLIDGGIHRLLELSGGGLLARTPLQRLDGDDDVEQGDLTGRLGECDAAAVAATRVSPPRRMDWRTLARRSPARDYDGCKLNRIHRCRHRRGEFLKASQALALRFANNPTTKCAALRSIKPFRGISGAIWRRTRIAVEIRSVPQSSTGRKNGRISESAQRSITTLAKQSALDYAWHTACLTDDFPNTFWTLDRERFLRERLSPLLRRRLPYRGHPRPPNLSAVMGRRTIAREMMTHVREPLA